MKKIYMLSMVVLMAMNIKAQQPVSYNLYSLNPVLLNPATMGENDCINAFINRQNKWNDLPNAPKVNTFGVYGKMTSNSSIGAMIVGDNRSFVSYLNANLLYAYHLKLSASQKLSLGLSAGFANNSLNTDRIQTHDKNDPNLQVFNSTKFDAGFGASYQYNALKIGFSIPHFFNQNGSFSSQYNVTASRDFKLKNPDWKLTPMAVARNYREVGMLVDVLGLASWKDKVTGMVGYRTDKSILAGIGFNWNMLRIGYAYQYNVGATYNTFSSSGTHEIQLAIRFCRKNEPMPVVAEKKDPNADKVNVNVNMTDEKYGNPVAGNITILKGNSKVYQGTGDNSGKSTFHLNPDVYTMLITAKGYVPVEEKIDISKNEKGSKYDVQLKPIKIEKGLVFKLKSINFETGSDKLTKSSYNILDKMAEILNENPQMIVEVGGHTDNVGDDKKNLELSQKRANSVQDYLSTKGVKAAQMKAVGFGETNPIASNDTDEGRLQNRRVMFTVLEY